MHNLRRSNTDSKASDGLARLTVKTREVSLLSKDEEEGNSSPGALPGLRSSTAKKGEGALKSSAASLAAASADAAAAAKEATDEEGNEDLDVAATRAAQRAKKHTPSARSAAVRRSSSAGGGNARRSSIAANQKRAAAVKTAQKTSSAGVSSSKLSIASARAAATASAWVKTVIAAAAAVVTSAPIVGVVSAVTAVVVLIVAVLAFIVPSAVATCETGISGGRVDPSSISDTAIAGYGHEQLVNAAHIVTAGSDLGLSVRDQTIAVMTAMGESSLRNIDYGDGAINPDGSVATSIGLFQQQANWGSVADRMDPYKSATLFYQALQSKVSAEDRASLAPTVVAHRVQVNADANFYTVFWDPATAVVAGLTGVKATGVGGYSNLGCNDGPLLPGQIGKDGWASPATGPLTDYFGPRPVIDTPSGPTNPFHRGLDFDGGGCGGPIWAARAGTVSNVFTDSGGTWTMDIDHGNGLMTRYLHMWADGILVKQGDKVKAGQQVAKVGDSGYSIGCHLHFEVHLNGEPIDPLAVLNNAGITY